MHLLVARRQRQINSGLRSPLRRNHLRQVRITDRRYCVATHSHIKQPESSESKSRIEEDVFLARPHGFWKHLYNQKRYFDFLIQYIARTTGQEPSLDLLYSASYSLLRKTGGQGILHYYNWSVEQALKTIFPTHKWEPWRFTHASLRWWNSPRNRRILLDDFFQLELGQRKVNKEQQLDELINIINDIDFKKVDDHLTRRLRTLSKLYKSSFAHAIMVEYPEIAWKPWKFHVRGWWPAMGAHFVPSITGVNEVVDPVAESVAIDIIHDLLKCHAPDLLELVVKPVSGEDELQQVAARISNELSGCLNSSERRHLLYLGGLQQLVALLMRKYSGLWDTKAKGNSMQLQPFEPPTKDLSWWNDLENQRRYLTYIKEQIGGTFDSLYTLTEQHLIATGGVAILSKYDYSVSRLVKTLFPEHPWRDWRFQTLPRGYIDSLAAGFQRGDENAMQSIKELIDELGQQLHITSLEDWYTVSNEQLGNRFELIKNLGKLPAILTRLYPHHRWEDPRFSLTLTKKSAHKLVVRFMSKMFPNQEIVEEATCSTLQFKRAPTVSADRFARVKFDICLPNLRLAIEYHGKQHFRDTHSFQEQLNQRLSDTAKRELCRYNNFTLIEIPYWWDNRFESLANSIHLERPDLIAEPVGDGKSINMLKPANVHLQSLQDKALFARPGRTIALTAESEIECEGWWMVENLCTEDSVWCLWDGHQFITSLDGPPLSVPPQLLKLMRHLAPMPLEGILRSFA